MSQFVSFMIGGVCGVILGILMTAESILETGFEKGQISVGSGLTSCELVETVNKDKSKSEDWVCTKDDKE